MIEQDTRTFPHAPGIEKAVLSVLMKYPARMDDAASVTEDHFHLPGHRILHRHIAEEARAGRVIDLVICAQTLSDRGELDAIGGPGALSDVYTYAPNDQHFDRHLAGLRDFLARRRALALAGEMERLAYEADTAQELVDATSAPITALHDLLAESRPARDTQAVLAACLETFRARAAGREQAMGIPTSLAEINARFRGLHPGRTVILSGYPGGGKTTLAGQLAMDAALGGHHTLICSLEMGAEDLMNRMLAYTAGLPGDALTDPVRHAREVTGKDTPDPHTVRRIEAAVRTVAAAPFTIRDMVGANVHQLQAAIRGIHRRRALRVVVVDFAQRIRPVPEMRRESREQQLAHASNTLADLARELGFCLLLPSQLNKEGAAKHAEAINEDADLHLTIVQDRAGPAPTLKHLGIAVAKDRHYGQFGESIPIVLDGPMMRFVPKE